MGGYGRCRIRRYGRLRSLPATSAAAEALARFEEKR